MLSTSEGDASISRSLAADARGYMLKTMLPNEMLDAIRAAHADHKYILPLVATQLAAYLSEQSLSMRESEILKHVARGNWNIGELLLSASGPSRITRATSWTSSRLVIDSIPSVLL